MQRGTGETPGPIRLVVKAKVAGAGEAGTRPGQTWGRRLAGGRPCAGTALRVDPPPCEDRAVTQRWCPLRP